MREHHHRPALAEHHPVQLDAVAGRERDGRRLRSAGGDVRPALGGEGRRPPVRPVLHEEVECGGRDRRGRGAPDEVDAVLVAGNGDEPGVRPGGGVGERRRVLRRVRVVRGDGEQRRDAELPRRREDVPPPEIALGGERHDRRRELRPRGRREDRRLGALRGSDEHDPLRAASSQRPRCGCDLPLRRARAVVEREHEQTLRRRRACER